MYRRPTDDRKLVTEHIQWLLNYYIRFEIKMQKQNKTNKQTKQKQQHTFFSYRLLIILLLKNINFCFI